MVPFAQLLLPIILSSVLVFVASSLMHMVLKYHNSDYKQLKNEEEVRAAINKGSPGPGQYMLPYSPSPDAMKDPEIQRKFTEGPVGGLILRPPGMMKLGSFLGQWFGYVLLISALVALTAWHVLAPGTPYMAVFHVVGLVALLGYSGSYATFAIWSGLPWSITAKHIFDGLIFALLTAGTFAWLWPKV